MRPLTLLALLAGCHRAEPAPGRPSPPGSADSGAPGPTTPTSGSTGHPGERFTLVGGEVVEGQVIATYDQRRWRWTPADQTWLAVFDPSGWAAYPDDRSLRLIRESDVASREARWLEGPTWAEWLRDQGIGWATPPLAGTAWVITGNEGYHLEEDGYGDFAWDLVQTDPDGARFTGTGADNADYLVWGQPVVAALAGTVVEVVRDQPDHPPGAYPPGAGNNLVGIRVGGQLYQYALHLQQGSIPASIAVGREVQAGELLGRVGNSGVSLEPHLHLTLHYWANAVPGEERFWSVPSEWPALYVADQPTGAVLVEQAVPRSGQWIGPEPF